MRKSRGAARIDDLLRRHFEGEVRRVKVPELEAGGAPSWRRPMFPLRDFLARAAATAVMAALIAVLPAAERASTPLRQAAERVWKEKMYQRYAPGAERLWKLILQSMEGRKTQ